MKTWRDRIDDYAFESGFPTSLFTAGDGRVVGTWILGNSYKIESKVYGGFPPTYLKRLRSLFRDKKSVLHLFSYTYRAGIFPNEEMVDIDASCNPTYVDDAQTLLSVFRRL